MDFNPVIPDPGQMLQSRNPWIGGVSGYWIENCPINVHHLVIQEAQLSLTNCATLFCKVVEVAGLFVRKRRQEVHNRLQCSISCTM